MKKFESFNRKRFFNNYLGMSQRYTAFTLAEVMITLAIIGIVAAITIPVLIQKADEQSYITALKTNYSILTNAFTLAVQENGTPDNWDMQPLDVNSKDLILLKNYLKLTKDCIDGSSGCFSPGTTYKFLANSLGDDANYDEMYYSTIKLINGTSLQSEILSPDCSGSVGNSHELKNICGVYWVDINGDKKPNQWGKDMFQFFLTKDGIVPTGSKETTMWSTFDNNCRDKDNSNGMGCAAWVLYNGNMDYLHCSDLSWDGKKKCN